jgi:hypothetical protein
MAQKKISDLPALASLKATGLVEVSQDGVSYKSEAQQVWTPALRKNAIINGDFNVWQRGITFTSVANLTYVADRYRYVLVGAAVHDISRSVDVPSVAQAGRLFNYSMLVDCTTVDASIAAADFSLVQQVIEGYNWLPLAQRAFTLSFWVKATKTGTYCVSFTNAGGDRSYVAEYTISATDTWEKKTISVPASPSAGAWDYTNGVGLVVKWVLAVGSNLQTTAGSWQTGSFHGTSNQVNATDSTANNFRITGMQLEVGSVATEIEQRTFNDELAMCQRYFNKTYRQVDAPGTVTTTGQLAGAAAGAGTGNFAMSYRFPVSMRSNPTMTFYSPATGASGNWRRNTGAADVAVVTVAGAQSEECVGIQNNAAVTDAEIITGHLTASAEL